MTDKEKIKVLERENELLKEQIRLMEELEKIKNEKRSIGIDDITLPYTPLPYNPIYYNGDGFKITTTPATVPNRDYTDYSKITCSTKKEGDA